MRSSAVLAVFAVFAPSVAAQSVYQVGVAPLPPHVIVGSELQGFDIDLWNEIARHSDFDFEFRPMPFEELLPALESGELDAAVAGITITAEREQTLDFSHPYMRSGLRILTPLNASGGLPGLLRGAIASGAAQALFSLVGFLLLCAHLFWLAERRGGAVSKAYFPGVLESAWCMLATITTVGYGDIAPKRWLGRLVSFAVMVIGIGLFGVLVAQISVGMTLQELRAGIRGPEDLSGRVVATVAGSTSVAAAEGLGARVRETADVEAAVDAVTAGSAQAVVFDGPPLLHYVSERPEAPVGVVGPRLNSENYGVAFPEGSALRETVNRALLELRENGVYERLYERWFGVQPSP